MKEKKKLKMRKIKLHPVTTFILLTILVVILSGIFSLFEMQATYSRINPATNSYESVLVTVENLLNYDGMKYIISNAARNFISFTPLSMMLISLIGVTIAQATGFLDTFIKRNCIRLDNKTITFLLVFLATASSLINEVGYVLLIPLGAILFMANGRNPLVGVISAFCGVSFGYGVTLFVGSMEVDLIPYTKLAANFIDKGFHVSLTSNLFIMIVTCIILSIVGTFIIEKFIVKKIGKYTDKYEGNFTNQIEFINEEEEEQRKIAQEKYEKQGLKYAYIIGTIVVAIFIYMLIPNLPGSGMLLDMNEKTYLNQVFGVNSYFQDGFTYMVCLLLILVGIGYGIGSKSIKNDTDLVNKSFKYMNEIGSLVALVFFASQFIAIFKKTNIGTIIVAWGANLINSLSFTGVPLIILVLLVIALANLFVTTPTLKWAILSPTVVPLLMQSNVAPQFAQFLLRAGDSMTNGITPLLAYFVIFIGYLNIYNKDKANPITIGKAISYTAPYSLIISITWILVVLGWYLINLPIGPGVFPGL